MNRIVRAYCWACMDRTRYVLAVGLGAFGSAMALFLIVWFWLTGRLSGDMVETAFTLSWIVGALFGLAMWYMVGRKVRKAIQDAVNESAPPRG